MTAYLAFLVALAFVIALAYLTRGRRRRETWQGPKRGDRYVIVGDPASKRDLSRKFTAGELAKRERVRR